MNSDDVLVLIIKFIGDNGNNPKNWKVKVLNRPYLDAAKVGCYYKCDSYEDAIGLQNVLVSTYGLKEITTSLIGDINYHNKISVYQ